MLNVIWTAACDVSGYSQCARDYVLALGSNPDFNLHYDTFTACQMVDGAGIDHATLTRLKKHMNNAISKPFVRVCHSIPDRFEIDLQAALNIGYTVTESECIPKQWAPTINQMDGLLTCSEYCKQIFENNGVTVPIFVIPHCHNLQDFRDVGKYNIQNLKKYNFLFVADMTPRKGWRELLEAYCNEFHREDNVSLTMKVYSKSFTAESQLECKNKIKTFINEMGFIPNETTPPIFFYGHCLPNSCVPRFVNSFDCLVSPHRSEGWGLNLSSSMLLGKPVIATRGSGNMGFMNESNSFLISTGALEEVPQEMVDLNSNYKGASWPTINVEELRQTMRWVVEHPEQASARGAKAMGDIANQCNYDAISKSVYDAIKEISHLRNKGNDCGLYEYHGSSRLG